MRKLLFVFLLAASGAHGALNVSGTVNLSGTLQFGGNALTVPNQVTSVSPANGETHVNYLPTISWQNGGGALTYQVFFDTNNPPTTSVQNSAATSYAPSALAFSTTYYLKINSINNSGTTTGSVYSFVTEPVYLVDGYSSFNVGGSDGDTLTTAKLDSGTELGAGVWTFPTTAAQSIKDTWLYKIATNPGGTTDFTTIGAADNNVGTTFTATGSGSGLGGTGTVTVPLAFVSGSPTALYSPFKNGATIYPGTSATTAIKFRADVGQDVAQQSIPGSISSLVCSFWFTFGPLAGSNPVARDMFQITNTAGGWIIISDDKNNGGLDGEFGPGGSGGTPFSITTLVPNTTYRVVVYAGQNGSTVNAGSLVVGVPYKIGTAGNTSWTSVGAADNNVGTFFIATGAGSGTGVANAAHVLQFYTTTGTLLGSIYYDCSANTPGTYGYFQFGRNDAHTGGNQSPTSAYITYSQFGYKTSSPVLPYAP